VTVTAKVKDEITFLVEASQAAVFQIRNVDGENLDMTLGITAPNIVYPYLRETISQSISRAGFPPVILQPMNFEAIYRARKKEQESAQANEATKH
jgi:preprotein translocase subunit SecB